MPVEELQSLAGSKADRERITAANAALEEGGSAEDLVTDEDTGRGFALYARLVIGWRVYDATSTAEDQPLLPLPATPELIGKLPQEILTRITEEVGKANPPAAQADGTGKTS